MDKPSSVSGTANKNTFRFLNYNIEGLLNKLDNVDFIQFLHGFDFVCLTETFLNFELNDCVFKDFILFNAPARKLSHRGRCSGGTLVMVKKCFDQFFERIDVKFHNIVALKMCKTLVDVDRDVLIIAGYIPPPDSPAYSDLDNVTGVEILEQCVLELGSIITEDVYIMMCGDFNARTGNQNSVCNIEEWPRNSNDEYFIHRSSQDSMENAQGNQLIDLCNVLDCSILNGATSFQFDNEMTFISATGKSVIDYFVLSNDLCHTGFLQSLKIAERIESSHLPVILEICITLDGRPNNQPVVQKIERFVWDKGKENIFVTELNTTETQDRLAHALLEIPTNVNHALDLFVDCVKSASHCMKKTITVGCGTNKTQSWFDQECSNKRRETKSKLRRYRRTQKETDRIGYVTARSEYNKLLRKKRQNYKQKKVDYLSSVLGQPSEFWKEVRACTGMRRRKTLDNSIPKTDWVKHFRDVYSLDAHDSESDARRSSEVPSSTDELDNEISPDEVRLAIRKLKTGKSPGHDDILAEMLKGGHDVFVSFLTDLFNHVFSSGSFPEMWTKSIIVPIHKKGDMHCVDNYRGVSLLSIVSKCYTFILNRRLYNWVEDGEKITETQAGFRKGYSTADHIFTLYAMTQKYLSKKGGKLYVAFVDLRRAFDSVQHSKLLETLQEIGLSEHFTNAIMSMYESVKASVKIYQDTTDEFDCEKGLKQGCILSPTLFSLFINKMASKMEEMGKHGVQLIPGLIELFILLFADDLALMSSTPQGLQNQLDILLETCKELGVEVNISKTKAMVFRNGGFLGKSEKWYLGSEQLEVVKKYVYLGFTFTTAMSTTQSSKQLAIKGKRATFDMVRALNKLEVVTKDIFFKMFDAQIQPCLLYASEVWGLLATDDDVEKVHTYACKRFLNVSLRTPNSFVYGELGRFPLVVNCCVRVIRYWFRVLKMETSRLPHQAYKMLCTLDENGKNNWVTTVRQTLSRLGFGFVWLNQGVVAEQIFVLQLKQRFIDVYSQEWMANLRGSTRFDSYISFKVSLKCEPYLDFVKIKCFRDALIRLRLGITELRTHKNRYVSHVTDNNCPFCKDVEETECHFLFHCSMYQTIRPNILKYTERHAEHWKFKEIMLCEDQASTKQLAWFAFKAFQIRAKLLQ